MLKIKWRDIVGFIISGGLLWLTWYQSGIKLSQISFSATTVGLLSYAMLAFLFTLVVHIFKASLLWKSNALARPSAIATSLFIGNFFNVVLPGNLGEAIRAWHFHLKCRVSIWQSTAGIIAEKFVDANLFITAIILFFSIWPNSLQQPKFLWLIMLLLGVIFVDIILYILIKKPRAAKIIWRLTPSKWLRKQLYKTFRCFVHHFENLQKNGHLWTFSSLGYLMFLLNMVQYYLVFRAAGVSTALNTPLTLFLVSLVMVVINVTPSAPGSAGVVHYGIFATLMLTAELSHLQQQPIEFAMAGMLLHLSYFIPESCIGAYYIWRERDTLATWKKNH
jgi:uncharacterized protein (TIRG00374 family)